MGLLRCLAPIMLFVCSAASAQTQVFSDDFDFDTTNDFSGTRGWVSRYAGDNWSTFFAFGVYAKTDDSGGTYGSGGAADNLLLQTGSSYTDFLLEEQIHVSNDNDGIGLAFRTTSLTNTYLLVMADGGDIPGEGTGAVTQVSGTVLYAIVDGVATKIGESAAHYQQNQTHLLRVIARRDAIEIWFDDDRNGLFETEDRIISVTDGSHSSGLFGLYCYNAGNGDTDGCLHDEVAVYILDTDGDGVADPADNCLFESNLLQEDLDGDGVGDVCDPDVDGDASLAVDDCNDRNAAIHPGAEEQCDGVDTDCDGSLDNGACPDLNEPIDLSAPADLAPPSVEDAAPSPDDAASSPDDSAPSPDDAASSPDDAASSPDDSGLQEDAGALDDLAGPIEDLALAAIVDGQTSDARALTPSLAGGGCTCDAASTRRPDLFAILIALVVMAMLRPRRARA